MSDDDLLGPVIEDQSKRIAELEQLLAKAQRQLAEWERFAKTDIYQQFTDVRTKLRRTKRDLAKMTQERDEWRDLYDDLRKHTQKEEP